MTFEPETDLDASMEERYRTLFENSRDGIYVISPEGRFVDVNPALTELVGRGRDELVGKSLTELYVDAEVGRSMLARVSGEGFVKDVEVRFRGGEGEERTCVVLMVVEKDDRGGVTGYHGIVHDITERGLVEERLRHAALYDALTQLPNRTFFIDRVGRLLDRMHFKMGYQFAVLVAQLDRFKLINDTMGHRAGDELLVQVAQRLTLLVRPEDIVARLGGDEFAILLLDLKGAEDAETICSRIREGFMQPFAIGGGEAYVRASMGIALTRGGDESAEDLVRDAGTAMWVSKREGLGGWAIFEQAMRERAVALLDVENALRRALERDELLLYYQPIVDISSGRVDGFEALLRWKHPTRGLLTPSAFLSVAEESGLIVPIGEWVLRESCRTIGEWREQAPDTGPLPTVSVNVSGRQLMLPGLAQQVRGMLEEYGVPGAALRIEITESMFLERSEVLMNTLRELSALGIKLSLDDFGTGYSSLSSLRDLPVHVIKIDRSFVRQLPDAGGANMVQTILALARQLGLRAVAEGVETQAQREELLRLGCEHAQGYLFSAPVDHGRAQEFVHEGRVRDVLPARGMP
jgi:diguanylate cyclase (GGDEF)-like protein/PAS domain S-box-containing protein